MANRPGENTGLLRIRCLVAVSWAFGVVFGAAVFCFPGVLGVPGLIRMRRNVAVGIRRQLPIARRDEVAMAAFAGVARDGSFRRGSFLSGCKGRSEQECGPEKNGRQVRQSLHREGRFRRGLRSWPEGKNGKRRRVEGLGTEGRRDLGTEGLREPSVCGCLFSLKTWAIRQIEL